MKEAIERDHGIPVADQVLLINGGESLEGNNRVCSYSAGLDSNPIYLFNKGAIERDEPPTPVVDYGFGELYIFENKFLFLFLYYVIFLKSF